MRFAPPAPPAAADIVAPAGRNCRQPTPAELARYAKTGHGLCQGSGVVTFQPAGKALSSLACTCAVKRMVAKHPGAFRVGGRGALFVDVDQEAAAKASAGAA